MTDELLTMNDLRPTPEQKAAEGRRKARVVFVMAHGTGLALCCEESIVLDYLSEVGSGATVDGFPLDSHGVDYDTKLPDGVYMGVMSLVDDGPGDYPGSREVCPSLGDARLATADEWRAFIEGEYPWDPKVEIT
jgi:hypothetical protein